jgi:hypothetical protein
VACPLGVAVLRLTAIAAAVLALLAPCAVLCQGSSIVSSSKSLPDAPAAQSYALSRAASLFASHWVSPVSDLSFCEATACESAPPGIVYSASGVWAEAFNEPPQNDAFTKDMVKLFRHNVVFHPATSGSLVRRAVEAASSVAIVRAPDGKGKLNTDYLLGVLSSAVLHTAYRPYWNRPVSAPFSDFGSTVGNDAGMNLLHQFAPGLQELVKSHTPKFVTKIAAGIAHR